MAKYRKRPIEVEAQRFFGKNTYTYMIGMWGKEFSDNSNYYSETNRISIHTLEGNMHIEAGDWIIKGVKGEFYPCKPDIFEQTYEQVSEGE